MTQKKIEEKCSVFLDFKGVKEIFKNRGIDKSMSDIQSGMGISPRSLDYYKKEAPAIVAVIHHFLKENDLRFEDLVKEVESKN
ncbi:hypothetical protein [Flavobacterium phage FL-1]|nr:hypothetical protein [Flavobacterium phage FL-1]